MMEKLIISTPVCKPFGIGFYSLRLTFMLEITYLNTITKITGYGV